MTQSLQIERPAARAFTLPTSFAAPRPPAPRTLATVPAAKPVEPVVTEEATGTEHLIKSIELAATRMTELVERQRAHDALVAELREQLADMTLCRERADDAAKLHQARADAAARDAEAMQARWQSQCDEQERLKASVNALLAMFNTPDAAAAHA